MIVRVTLLWVLGLVTIVPYGLYHLLFTAQRDEYAFLITIVLFWIFGFWGVVGPLISAWKVRQVMRALEMATSENELKKVLRSADAEEAAIDLIASENRIPKFLARKIYKLALKRLAAADDGKAAPAASSGRIRASG